MKWNAIDQEGLSCRAARSLTARPRPFLKWAGSKRLLLQQIIPHLPQRYGRYYEPFLGGGSLFFVVQPDRARLSDACEELVSTYQAVRDNLAAVLRYLSQMSPDKRTYYRVRGARSSGRFKNAAEFIFLNKTCWNGLYRVNQKGQFNVPFGAPPKGDLVDIENLRACSKALKKTGVSIKHEDFEDSVRDAGEGDVVFFDPPYVTGHRDNGFIDYNEVLFSWDDQRRLADLASRLATKGCHVLVTNAHHSAIEDLYRDFEHVHISRQSTIAGKADKRRASTELLLLRKPLDCYEPAK